MIRTITYIPRSAMEGLILFKSSTGHIPQSGDSVSLTHKSKVAKGKFEKGDIRFESLKNVPSEIVEADLEF